MAVFIVLFAISALAAAYFAARYFLLRSALNKCTVELQEINADLTQNHVLRLLSPEKPLGAFIAAVNDMLARIRAERVSYAERERAFRSQIEAISHDLRTPLTVIVGYIRIMQTDGAFSDELLGTILRKARSMQKLIAAFYEYSRVISGDISLSPAVFDAGKQLRETFADNCVVLEDKELEVVAHFAEYPVLIYADPSAFERIVVNLLHNAARYAKNFFEISFCQSGESAVALFKNDAPDLAPEQVGQLFERFYTVDNSRSAGGTGLGLTIARNLAQSMGGDLQADLSDGVLTFTLTFPVKKV